MTRLRVLIVDDEQPARERLRSLLVEIPDAEVVGEAVNGPQALTRTHELSPDVVLLDVMLPDMSGIEACRQIHAIAPKVPVKVKVDVEQFAYVPVHVG